jgi:serine protease Do
MKSFRGFKTAVAALTAMILVPLTAQDTAAAERAFLGMQIQGMQAEVAEALGRKDTHGVLVRDVGLGTPANKAGLKRGDLIVEFAGKTLDSFDRLIAIAGSLEAGQSADLVVIRQGRKTKLLLKTEKWPSAWNVPKDDFKIVPNLGITLSAISPKVRERFGLRWGSTGIVVTLVDEEKVKSLVRLVDLRRGEVILQVNQKPVWLPDQVMAAYAKAQTEGRKSILLLVEGSEGGRNGFRFSLLPVLAP